MSDKETFKVSVAEYVESHQTTYLVCLERGDRPEGAMPWDDGLITPFRHKNRDYVKAEAETWAKFLGVEVTD